MRFDSARAAGLDETTAEQVQDGYETRLPAADVAALKLADAFLGLAEAPSEADQRLIQNHFSETQIVELLLGVGLFHGMSKVLINLGLEPEQMPVTLLPTPGSVGHG